MKYFKVTILLLSLIIYFVGCTTVIPKTSKEKPRIGYLYEKPKIILEEEKKDSKTSEEIIEAEMENLKPLHEPPRGYLLPKQELHLLKANETDSGTNSTNSEHFLLDFGKNDENTKHNLTQSRSGLIAF